VSSTAGATPGTGAGYGRGAGNAFVNGSADGTGRAMGNGMGMGHGPGNGVGRTGDDCLLTEANLPAKGTLTSDQKSRLAGMAEEEKVAHDVYIVLAASSGDARFTRIAAAEQRHEDAVRTLLLRYGVSDPTSGKADGQFTSAAYQKVYDQDVAKGKVSLDAALAVGRQIEQMDIDDLAKAGQGVTAADAQTVYRQLSAGSSMHLRSFGG
jgi:hypothetical protein